MTIEECLQRNNKILKDFKEWKKGNATLNLSDLEYLACFFGLRTPKALRCLIQTSTPNSFRTNENSQNKLKQVQKFLTELSKYGDIKL